MNWRTKKAQLSKLTNEYGEEIANKIISNQNRTVKIEDVKAMYDLIKGNSLSLKIDIPVKQ